MRLPPALRQTAASGRLLEPWPRPDVWTRRHATDWIADRRTPIRAVAVTASDAVHCACRAAVPDAILRASCRRDDWLSMPDATHEYGECRKISIPSLPPMPSVADAHRSGVRSMSSGGPFSMDYRRVSAPARYRAAPIGACDARRAHRSMLPNLHCQD